MTVGSFDPSKHASNANAVPVQLSQAALDHARSQLQKEGALGMRLGVKKSGCSGFMYTLDWVKQPNPDDKVYTLADGVVLYVAQQDLEVVRGTEVDFVIEGLNASIKFKHPGAKSMCGCGESFGF
jgi:iron-sulfur cluster assembly accessory protein